MHTISNLQVRRCIQCPIHSLIHSIIQQIITECQTPHSAQQRQSEVEIIVPDFMELSLVVAKCASKIITKPNKMCKCLGGILHAAVSICNGRIWLCHSFKTILNQCQALFQLLEVPHNQVRHSRYPHGNYKIADALKGQEICWNLCIQEVEEPKFTLAQSDDKSTIHYSMPPSLILSRSSLVSI